MKIDFITACFIRKNTQELRDKLESLGYEILDSTYKTICGNPIDEGVAIITYEDDHKTYAVADKINHVIEHGRFDCEENEDLFFAVACNSKYRIIQYDEYFEILRKSSIVELIEDYKHEGRLCNI